MSKIIGSLVCLSATLVTIPNWLWLMGLAQKPTEDLLESRWIYAFVGYTVGVCLFVVDATTR